MSEDIIELKQVKHLFNPLSRDENSVEIIRFLAKSAIDPKHCLLVFYLFTSKIYTYPIFFYNREHR